MHSTYFSYAFLHVLYTCISYMFYLHVFSPCLPVHILACFTSMHSCLFYLYIFHLFYLYIFLSSLPVYILTCFSRILSLMIFTSMLFLHCISCCCSFAILRFVSRCCLSIFIISWLVSSHTLQESKYMYW